MGGNESKTAVKNRNLYINENVYNIVCETINSTDVKVEVKSEAKNKSEMGDTNISGNTDSNIDVTITSEMKAFVRQCVEMKSIIDSVMSQLTKTDDQFDALMGMQNGLEQEGSETAAQVASKDSTTVEGDNSVINRTDINIENITKIMATYKFLMYALAENQAVMGNLNITNNTNCNIRFTKGDKMDASIDNNTVSEVMQTAATESGMDKKSIERAQQESTAAAKKTATAAAITDDISSTIKQLSSDVTKMIGEGLGAWFSQNKTIFIVIGVVIVAIFLSIAGILIFKSVSKNKSEQQMIQAQQQMRLQQMQHMSNWKPEQQMQFYQQQNQHERQMQQDNFDYRNQRRNQYMNQFNSMTDKYIPVRQPQQIPQQEYYQEEEVQYPSYPNQTSVPNMMESEVYYGGGKTEFEDDNEIERLIEPIVLNEHNEIVGVRSKKVVGSYDLYDKYGNKVKFNYELKKFYNIDDIELINDKTEEQLMEGAGINPAMIKNLVSTGTKFVKKGAKYAKKGVKYVAAHKDQIKQGYKTAKKYGKKGLQFVDKHKNEFKEAGRAVHDVYREIRPKQVQPQQPQRVVQQPVKAEQQPTNVGPVNDFDVPI
jgi:type II secretory pathway pseudopilin PulG